MIELVLTVIILALLGYHAYSERLHKQEREKMINAIMSKNAIEMRDLEIAENTQVKVDVPKEPELEPLENLSDQQHYDAILGKLNMPNLDNG